MGIISQQQPGQWEERDLILSMGRKEKQELNPPETGDAGDKIR
jgi:hypothetical protein